MLPKIWVSSLEGITKVKCYTCHSNHAFYVLATIMSLVFLFSTLYRLEVMFQCCNNLSYIFFHTYVFPLLSIQSKINGLANSITNRQCCLPLRHYYMMLLLVLLGFNAPSFDYLSKMTHLLVKSAEWLLESSSWLKQSHMLGQSMLWTRALCSSQERFLIIW